MQKKRIVSAMMGTAISIIGLSAINVPVYAKSDFIFPTVSLSINEIKTEVSEEVVVVEDGNIDVVNETLREGVKIADENAEKVLLSNENIGLDIATTEEPSSLNPVFDLYDTEIEQAKVLEAVMNEGEIIASEIIDNFNEIDSSLIENIEFKDIIDVDLEELKSKLQLNHNICQIQHTIIDNCPIYNYPSKDIGSVIENISKKANIFIIGDSINNFYSISYNDEVYYIEKDNIVKILDDDFKNVEPRTVFLNRKTNLLNIKENQREAFLSENLAVNTKLEVIGEHELGYVKVLLGEEVGYISKDYCSENRLILQASEIQLAIAEKAADPDTAPCESGYCAAWVASVYRAAGLYSDVGMGDAIDFWTQWGIDDGITSSTRYDNIPIGAVVVGSGGGSELSNTYGHVGIYLGDGLVAENIGYHSVVTLEEWIVKNRGICDGYQGYIGWVFPFNIDLQDC